MRDLFLDVLYACGSISALAITVALLKTASNYVSGKMFLPKDQVFVTSPVTNAGTTSGWASMTLDEPIAAATKFDLPPPGLPPPGLPPPTGIIKPIESVDSTFPPPEQGRPIRSQEDFILECGNCRKHIKSSPISIDSKGGKTEMRYRCETCGATIAVKI